MAMSIHELENEITEEFGYFEDWMQKYEQRQRDQVPAMGQVIAKK